MSLVAQVLDRLKEAGFHWATRSGMTVAIGDVIIPAAKDEILARYEGQADRVEKAYQRGNLSHDERNDDLVKIWEAATAEVGSAIESAYPEGATRSIPWSRPAPRATGSRSGRSRA